MTVAVPGKGKSEFSTGKVPPPSGVHQTSEIGEFSGYYTEFSG